jgi:hypothetical protein
MKRVPVIYQYDLQYVIFISVLNLIIHHSEIINLIKIDYYQDKPQFNT